MNVPNLPTDNLYKFMAIAGIVIAAGGGLASYAAWQKADQDLFLLQIDVDRLKAEIQHADERELILPEIHVAQAELSARADRARDVSNRLTGLAITSVLMILAGAGLALNGFRLWYTRLQVHHDELLRRQVGD